MLEKMYEMVYEKRLMRARGRGRDEEMRADLDCIKAWKYAVSLG